MIARYFMFSAGVSVVRPSVQCPRSAILNPISETGGRGMGIWMETGLVTTEESPEESWMGGVVGGTVRYFRFGGYIRARGNHGRGCGLWVWEGGRGTGSPRW